jgi:hypothetical protein
LAATHGLPPFAAGTPTKNTRVCVAPALDPHGHGLGDHAPQLPWQSVETKHAPMPAVQAGEMLGQAVPVPPGAVTWLQDRTPAPSQAEVHSVQFPLQLLFELIGHGATLQCRVAAVPLVVAHALPP